MSGEILQAFDVQRLKLRAGLLRGFGAAGHQGLSATGPLRLAQP